MENLSDIETLFNTLMQLGKLISQQASDTYEERTATMLQFIALNWIKDHKNATVGDFAKSLQLSKSSATQLVERLTKAELVERVQDTEDKRIIRLVITREGEIESATLRNTILKKMEQFAAKIPQKDMKELIRIHTNLIEALQKEHHEKN